MEAGEQVFVGLYNWYLAARIKTHDADPPDHVALVITERDLLETGAYDTLSNLFEWAFAYGANRVTVYVSVLDPEAIAPLCRSIEDIDAPRPLSVWRPNDTGQPDAPIRVGVGLGGKHEFTTAVRSLAEAVDDGELDPDNVSAADVESELVFPTDPDLVIKTGAERLSDFMIWQSVYSELYFTDVNWRNFRKRDYLRAVREFKARTRRFGE